MKTPTLALAASALILLAPLAHAGETAVKPAPMDPAKTFAKFDKDRDGKLEDGELPKGWLLRYDADGDGHVGRKEYLAIMKRPAKLRMVNKMRDPAARARDMVRSFDRDKNGTVGREEYPGEAHVFKKADRNKSGELEMKELLNLAKDELDGIRRKMKSPGRYDFLTLFDMNRDRKVTADEYDGPTRAFKKYDKDGDGVVAYAELYPERMREMAMAAEANKPKPESMSVLKAMDGDGDGKVSRAEFKGTDAAWRRLDRNRDGWLTTSDAN